VVGVVLAGIVAMVVSTGPFDWWASMIGLTLLAVLWGYAHAPTSRQESVGLAAAVTLALIYTVGAPLEIWFGARISGDGQSGDVVLVMWLVLTALIYGLLELNRAQRGVGPPPAAGEVGADKLPDSAKAVGTPAPKTMGTPRSGRKRPAGAPPGADIGRGHGTTD
jgi:hypothetical protein